MNLAISDLVKQSALALGFELVGIARSDDPSLSAAIERYSKWVDSGFGASMEYLKRHTDQKASPESFLPGCKSVVCVAMLYGAEPELDDPTRAQVSLYTRGADYHELMSEKLKTLAEALEKEHGVKARTFADAEPV